MPRTRILTDSSAQFTKLTFAGRNLVQVVPFHIKLNGKEITDDPEIKTNLFPATAREGSLPELIAPTEEEYYRAIIDLSQSCDEVIAISISSQLSPSFTNLENAAASARGKVRIELVDSQTTGIGLGYLVQTSAEQAARGILPMEIENQIRGKLPLIYAQLCLPNLSYLNRSGYIGQSQAIVGEMLSVLPVYSFEEGKLISIEKMKNARHLLDYFQEFLDEFSDLDYIALMQSNPPMLSESRALREHTSLVFPKTPYSEHTLNPVLAAMFGPKSIGVFAFESLPD